MDKIIKNKTKAELKREEKGKAFFSELILQSIIDKFGTIYNSEKEADDAADDLLAKNLYTEVWIQNFHDKYYIITDKKDLLDW